MHSCVKGVQEASDHELSTREVGGAPQEVTPCSWPAVPTGISLPPSLVFPVSETRGWHGMAGFPVWGPYSLLLLVSKGRWSVRGPMRCTAGGAAGKREGPLDTSSLYPADPGGCHGQLSVILRLTNARLAADDFQTWVRSFRDPQLKWSRPLNPPYLGFLPFQV